MDDEILLPYIDSSFIPNPRRIGQAFAFLYKNHNPFLMIGPDSYFI